ncbi:MAG: hypothetical protein IJ735_03010 [Clostridia bacterium]|nr:hypothetical protein [Clostridia bacterium]
MARKRKKKVNQKTTEKPIETKSNEFHFELTPPEPIFREDGTRDYYNEYYRAYKNDYIDQYMRAYREFKDINAAIEHVDKNNPPSKNK